MNGKYIHEQTIVQFSVTPSQNCVLNVKELDDGPSANVNPIHYESWNSVAKYG